MPALSDCSSGYWRKQWETLVLAHGSRSWGYKTRDSPRLFEHVLLCVFWCLSQCVLWKLVLRGGVFEQWLSLSALTHEASIKELRWLGTARGRVLVYHRQDPEFEF